MLYGIKSKKSVLFRHLCVAIFSGLLVYLFYLSYGSWGVEISLFPDWGADHPFWRAWAHAAFILLFLAIILSPAAILWPLFRRFTSWKREFGIWFAVLSFGHAYAIWDRWARWDVARLFGFEYVEEVGGYILLRPEVGIMNMMGLVIAPMIILLVITSFDKAVKFLGSSSWKWLHSGLIQVIFYVVMLRGVLYLFYFFQYSPPNWRVYPSIWFLYVFLGMAIFVVVLQAAAFVKTVLKRRSRKQRTSFSQLVAIIGVAIIFIMPMTLMTATVVYFDKQSIKEPPVLAEEEIQQTQDYANSFEMVIHSSDQDVYLWAMNLNNEPYFRQLIKMSGETISDEIYRYSEQSLYFAEQNADKELVWSKIENMSPEDSGISELAMGPGTWALQYGTGEHQIQFLEGVLQISIYSVGEVISDEVFEIPVDVESVSVLF